MNCWVGFHPLVGPYTLYTAMSFCLDIITFSEMAASYLSGVNNNHELQIVIYKIDQDWSHDYNYLWSLYNHYKSMYVHICTPL